MKIYLDLRKNEKPFDDKFKFYFPPIYINYNILKFF